MRKRFGSFGSILYLIAPYWKYGKLYLLGRIMIPILFAPALALLEVSVIQTAIDTMAAGASMEKTIASVTLLFAAILGLTLLQWAFNLLYDRWKAQEIRVRINRSIYKQAIATDYKYFDNPDFYNSFTFAAGELADKSESALKLLTDILASVSTIAAMTAYLATIGPWVIVISVAGQTVCFFAQRMIQKQGFRKAEEALPFDRKLNYIHRIAYQKQYAADMKSTGLSDKILAMFDKSGEGKVAVFKRLAIPQYGANCLQFIAWNLCRLAQLAYLIARIFAQGLSMGMVSGMFAAASGLNNHLNSIVGFSGRAMELHLYAVKIRAFWEFPSEIETKKEGMAPSPAAFSVELKNVSFAYPNADFRLRGLNLHIAPGEKIAIVGENGVGKTTLAKLLLRLYDTDEGEIYYNGAPIHAYNIHTLRRHIGMAFQEPQLYALSVRENMTLYHTIDDALLTDALRKTGLPIGLEDTVTREFAEDGVILSGGQAQKLGLTRLLHGTFGLLLLDEPSSALDPIAEHEMTQLIFEQAQTTTIMVAHRLSTIRNADRIYLLADGGVAEAGTHDELLALGGKYAEMFTKQAEKYLLNAIPNKA